MMKLKVTPFLLLAGMTFGATQVQAQGPGGGGGGGFNPAQMLQRRIDNMKTQMTAMGVAAATQDTIVAYVTARETAATPIRAMSRDLQQGLGNNMTAEAATTQLTALRAAITAEKTRRAQAEKDLETAISFSKNPQLEAYLTVMGLVGDDGGILSQQGGGRRGGGGGQGGPAA
jgi:hypothetical protein